VKTTQRPPAVAGTFYPASPVELERTIDTLLAGAGVQQGRALPKAVIVPHAGYVYSGPIAASAYALFALGAGLVKRVVIVGPAHRVYVRGVASSGA